LITKLFIEFIAVIYPLRKTATCRLTYVSTHGTTFIGCYLFRGAQELHWVLKYWRRDQIWNVKTRLILPTSLFILGETVIITTSLKAARPKGTFLDTLGKAVRRLQIGVRAQSLERLLRLRDIDLLGTQFTYEGGRTSLILRTCDSVTFEAFPSETARCLPTSCFTK
jgi:hypothetical protein